MTKYAILLGYGLFEESNINYRKYLDNFVSFVNQNKTDTIVLCGGRTDPKHPSRSEAQSMKDYIKPRIKVNAKILLERKSLTSAQNIDFAKKLIQLKNNEISIFCDNIKPPQIMWYVLHYWFKFSKSNIEKYYINYARKYYTKHYTTEQIGKEIVKGISYKNVIIKPYKMRTDIDDSVSSQISSILQINSLYDKKLYKEFIKSIRIKFGLKR
jgi:hypothetical protein